MWPRRLSGEKASPGVRRRGSRPQGRPRVLPLQVICRRGSTTRDQHTTHPTLKCIAAER